VNPVISAVGMTAATIGITCSTPQVWRLWRSPDAEGVSHASAVLGVLASSTWLAYGLSLVDWAQITANIPGVAGALAILTLVVLRSGASFRPALAAAVAWSVVALVTFRIGGPQALGVAATAVTLSARGPQVWTAYRSTSLSALSPLSFALTVVSASLWVTYGVGTGEAPVFTSATAGLTLSLLILVRVWHLGRRRSEPSRAGATQPVAVLAVPAPAAAPDRATVAAAARELVPVFPGQPSSPRAAGLGVPLPPTPRSGIPIPVG